jgi:DNA polymerase-4
MKKVPMSLIAKRFGNPGRRIWLMAQGKDPEPVITEVKDPKSIGHGKVMPPGTREKDVLLTYFQHMSEKVGVRLRRHQFQSDSFFIGVKTEQGWLSAKAKLHNSTDDGGTIYKLCMDFVETYYFGQECRQVQVTAISPEHGKQQDLFIDNDAKQKRDSLNKALDNINQRYGEFTVAPMRVVGRSEMPNVIAPAWKPTGHRKTI